MKIIVRNLLFTLAIGAGVLLFLPNPASAAQCTGQCLCVQEAHEDWAACVANCNSTACDNCATPANEAACIFNFRGCGEQASCTAPNTCSAACNGAYEASIFDCHGGC